MKRLWWSNAILLNLLYTEYFDILWYKFPVYDSDFSNIHYYQEVINSYMSVVIERIASQTYNETNDEKESMRNFYCSTFQQV